MVSDVRMKVKNRLRECLNAIARDAAPGGRPSQLVVAARTNETAAVAVRTHYRTWVAHEFPGCDIRFGRQNVYIHLPSEYPAANVPIQEQLWPLLIECFHPKGVTEL